MKHIHTSDIQAYSRYVLVYSGIAECEYCKTKKQILSVDTSDDEYQRFECCLDCFTGLLKMGEDKEQEPDTNMILDPELAKRMHMDRDGNIGIGSPEMRKKK